MGLRGEEVGKSGKNDHFLHRFPVPSHDREVFLFEGGVPMIRSFCGEYQCAADTKGRLMIPSKMRELFPQGESIILVRSLDRCINLYTEEKWRFFEEKIALLPETESRDVRRFFYASMQDVEPDSQGRILLPVQLRAFAGIQKYFLRNGENYVLCFTCYINYLG